MNIYEYQAKKILKNFGISIPTGMIAYTPLEAKAAALKVSSEGPWIIKAQILAGARRSGKFLDKRAGKQGGIRLVKNIDDVSRNADEMLENTLVTSQTDAKGRLVSRVYIEEYIKATKKFYLGIVANRISASAMMLLMPIAENDDEDILDKTIRNTGNVLKIDLGLRKTITNAMLQKAIEFIKYTGDASLLKSFFNKVLKIFYANDATMLEINPAGIQKNGRIWALDAKIMFDDNALYRHSDILKLKDEVGIDEREATASKYGFQYKELDNGIGIITNGRELALNIINEAQKQNLETACFLNLKGGADRDKIAASIKLIMTNPTVDGIFINILGGFSRCNLIADGIIAVANDLGLNIPLVARFEGTNKEEAINILQSSGLPLKIAPDTYTGLSMLKEAIEEDL